MKKNKFVVILLTSIMIPLSNCKDDDSEYLSINKPKRYVFERDGESTVSFGGQTTRILMAEEIINALKDNMLDEATIAAIFAHVEGNDDFSEVSLNVSDKSVRSKIAASKDFFSTNTASGTMIKEDFDEWITSQVTEVFPNWTTTALAGQAGFIQEAGGGSLRYVSAKGLEYNQIFGKGLIGALMVDQIVNNYVSISVLDAGTNREDNTNGTIVYEKTYTNMEHKWDEAYGYIYGTAENPANATIGTNDSFLNKYIGRVEEDDNFVGIAGDLYDALKLGRAAIVVGDYEIRNAQAEIIREKISTVIAVRAVYYIQQGKVGLEVSSVDYASVFHNLSEGYGFIYSLQFTRKPNSNSPYFTSAEVDEMLNDLLSSTNGFWDVTTTTLDDLSNRIAAKFSFTVEQAGS